MVNMIDIKQKANGSPQKRPWADLEFKSIYGKLKLEGGFPALTRVSPFAKISPALDRYFDSSSSKHELMIEHHTALFQLVNACVTYTIGPPLSAHRRPR